MSSSSRHVIKYFTSCSARKMLVTTLGVVLTLSVMWICRPSAHPLPSSRILRTPKESRFQTTSGSTSVELQSTLTSRKLKTRKLNINKRLLQNNYHSQMNITYNRVVPTELNSSDVYVSVRTTPLFHKSRLLLLLHTWLQTIDPKQVRIVTDSASDQWINTSKIAGFRVAVVNCGKTDRGLCCKTGHEFDEYYKETEAGKKHRWYCHFDDDEYVNVPVLMRTLRVHKDKVYLGHWPSKRRGWTKVTVIQQNSRLQLLSTHKNVSFYYATGAAYCISSTIMTQLEKYIRGRKFVTTCRTLRLAEDLTVGALIEGVLGYALTEVPMMHSQADTEDANCTVLKNQVTVGYKWHQKVVPGTAFTIEQDPSGFLAYHCLLYPSTSWCRRHRNETGHENSLLTSKQQYLI